MYEDPTGYRNSSGAPDPTAYRAVARTQDEEAAMDRMLGLRAHHLRARQARRRVRDRHDAGQADGREARMRIVEGRRAVLAYLLGRCAQKACIAVSTP